MKRALGFVGGALAFAVVAWAAACAEPPATADDGLPPVPAAIAARLPHYCRYDVDLSGVPNPHAEVLANTEWSDRTCPFAAGGAGPVRIYRPRGDQPCDASQLRGMKVAAVRDLDNRTGQREMRCVFEPSGGHGLPAALRGGGEAYLLTFDERAANADDKARFEYAGDLQRLGAPFVIEAGGERHSSPSDFGSAIAFRCVQMPPGVTVDALGFYREAGRPMPASVTQEEVTGQDCGQLIRDRVGPYWSTSGRASPSESVVDQGEFKLEFYASPRSPTGGALIHQVRAILARNGFVAARGSNRPTFVFGTEVVSRHPDGNFIGLTGGPDNQLVDLRALTPRVCSVLFDMASELHLFLQSEPALSDSVNFRPRSVLEDSAFIRVKDAIVVADATDLCALLQPGFDEWRQGAARLPASLVDVDQRKTTFSSFRLRSPHGRP